MEMAVTTGDQSNPTPSSSGHVVPMDTTTVEQSSDHPTGDRQVKKRKRRVLLKTQYSKDSGLPNPQAALIAQPLPEVSFDTNRELKYLKEHLGKAKDPSTKAAIYLRYLAQCDFNTEMEPHSIIRFSREDIQNLLSIEDTSESAMEVVGKLHQALQQRFQLAIQQSFVIGGFLSRCLSQHRQILSTHEDDEQRCRGRPRITSLLDILDGIEPLGASSSNLQDQVTVFNTVFNFPLLNYVNEPMSHLICSEVRSAIRHLPDRIHHDCDVPENLHQAHIGLSPYKSRVSEDEKPQLSHEIEFHTVTPCDGDGLIMNINIDLANPLQHAVFTRLNNIDAPELPVVHFVKTDDLKHVFCKRMGHISLCAVHLFLRLFVYTGSAQLCEELPNEDCSPPTGYYGRPLKEFWFRFINPPSYQSEQTFLESLELLVRGYPELRRRLMSPFLAANATESNPFLLSLNALLVVTGFCHVFTKFCSDKLLLGLQNVARENKMGPIWCGITRNFIHGCNSANTEDFILKHFTPQTTTNLEGSGYPLQNLQTATSFLPWHERLVKKQLCSSQTTRTQAKDHLSQHLPDKRPQFGMYTDIKRSDDPESKYESNKTGEAFLQVRVSSVVGVGSECTGMGLFTLKKIPRDTYVCAYAPTANMNEARNDGDYVIEMTFKDKNISIDGKQNPFELGLGVFCNDGSFPFSLAKGKYSRVIAHRVNCEFSKWCNEVWIKTTREIATGEELLVCYTDDRSYWTSIFSSDDLVKIANALAECGPTIEEAERCIRDIQL